LIIVIRPQLGEELLERVGDGEADFSVSNAFMS
jgi:hypothetical protein